MTKKEEINQDLKQAMLAGDKELVLVLRGIKSSILYAEVAAGGRETGLSDQAVTELLQKEAKKRQESADLYRQGNSEDRALKEEFEKKVIERYLPAKLSEEEIVKLIEQEIAKLDNLGPQQMGQIIGGVKKASNGAADGSTLARLVKERLSK